LPALAVNVKEDMLNTNREMRDMLNKENDKYNMKVTDLVTDYSELIACLTLIAVGG
jgi:hypothetical protein